MLSAFIMQGWAKSKESEQEHTVFVLHGSSLITQLVIAHRSWDLLFFQLLGLLNTILILISILALIHILLFFSGCLGQDQFDWLPSKNKVADEKKF